ncbi:pre-mRNA splicing regulator USH1G-like [Saccostrea echinata]|uniref:pre-mRNA splicing regulator USH1G-like n=1 Tax=Saccostrea echinata TaxID=191078 RepID=UPI002A83C264|nr:pre-mRNA splicing regulator USH1G-like [Saccostrea echinata]
MDDKYHRAAKDGFLDILRNATKKDLNSSDEDGMTPTLYAAAFGNLDALRMIVGRSGDPDKCDLQGFTALHHAAKNGHLNTVSFLVNFGCNIWALDNELHSAMDIAVIEDKVDIIAFLDDSQSKQQQKNPKVVQHMREKATKDAEQNIKRMERRQKEAAKYAEKEQRRIQEELNPDFKPPSKNPFKTLTMRLKPKRKDPTIANGNTTFSQIAQPSRRGLGGAQKRILQNQSSQSSGTIGDFKTSENIDGKRTLRSLAGTTGVRKGSDIMYVTNRENDPAARKPLSNVFPGMNGVSNSSKWKSESELLDSGVDSNDSIGYEDEEEKPGIFSRPNFGKIAFLSNRGVTGTLNAMGRSVSADFLDSQDQGFDDELNGLKSNRDSGSSESLGKNDVTEAGPNVPWNPDEVCSDDEEEDTQFSDLIRFLASCELSHYTYLFTDQDVDLQSLMTLAEEDLEELGLKLGPRRKLQRAIKIRKERLSTPSAITDSYL